MKTEQIAATYDRIAPTYDRTIGRAEGLVLGDFRARFGAALAGEVLEIGVGSGLNLPHYTTRVTGAVGLDLSTEMLGIAAERAAGLGLPVRFVQGDAMRLPFVDRAFDTVGVSLALCTIPDPAAALREMARVCRTGGEVVMLEHVLPPHRVLAGLFRAVSPLQERSVGCHLTRRPVELARELGFAPLEDRSARLGAIRLVRFQPPTG